MQIYALTHGLAACLFGIPLLGGCDRCACCPQMEAAYCGCVTVPASSAAQAPSQRLIPEAKPEVSKATPATPNSGPPRAEITFQPVEPPAPTHLPPAAPAKLPLPPAPAASPAPAATHDARFGHAPDYTWLRGQVEYLHTRKEWRLRYASLAETDLYGGHVILIENNQASYLVDGEFIRVEGHLVTAAEGRQGPPFYRIESFKTSQ